MTPKGKVRLDKELTYLLQVERLAIIKDIEEARAHGDISENSEYEDAKARQGICEARIRDLEGKVSRSEVIDVTKIEPSNRVIFGTTVDFTTYDEESDVEMSYCYQIVGIDEADLKKGKISYHSPIGQALLGKKIDEEVEVNTPNGMRILTIENVQYK